MSGRPLPLLPVGGLLALLIVVVLLASTFLVRPVAVVGRSMEPTLDPGDRLLADLWTYGRRPPRPGEVLLFDGPFPGQLPLIKRAGSPPAFPDDWPRPERWPPGSPPGAGIWVHGDNPVESGDSRSFGPVPTDRVRGRIFWRYWPPSRFGRVR